MKIKKGIGIILLSGICTFSISAVGTPVFDWTTYIQQVEEAFKEYDRWQAQYNKIMRDYEQVERQFKQADFNSFAGFTSFLNNTLQSASSIYEDALGKTNAKLDVASDISSSIAQASTSQSLRSDPDYWFDLLYRVSDSTTSQTDRVKSAIANLEAGQQNINQSETAYQENSSMAGDESEIVRSQSHYNILQQTATSQEEYYAEMRAKQAEAEANSILAEQQALAMKYAFEAAQKKGSQNVADALEKAYPAKSYSFFEPIAQASFGGISW